MEEKDLIRDPRSGALINKNTNAYRLYKAQRTKDLEAASQAEDVANLKQEVAELKQLLLEIAQRVK